MSSNMNNINYNEFKNICRTCLSKTSIKFPQDSVILDVFHKLTDLHFETNEDLPKQVCLKCFEKINEIHAFSLQCTRTHFMLMNCINNTKNIEINEETFNVKEETIEVMEIEPEITIEEDNKIEFVKVEANETTKVVDEEQKPNTSKRKNEHTYKCDQCTKSFPRAGSLEAHKRVHSGESPFKCDQCEKSFKQVGNLEVHKRVHSGERLFKCAVCTKSFTRAGSLEIHKRVHSGERPYKCAQCDKTFIRSDLLKIHERMHRGEHPYKCDVCQLFFSQLYNLKRHKKVHEKETKLFQVQ